MAQDHTDRVRDAFTAQASTFEDAELNFAFTAGIPWIVGASLPSATDRCLEVAAGTALISRALAPHVAHVIALDLTPAMLAGGVTRAASAQLSNLSFLLGDATALPFSPAEFDLVVTRFSLHHFEEPDVPLAEMVRVCRPGGRLVIMDLVGSTEPTVAAVQDEIERLRDASHVRMPTAGQVRRRLVELGVDVARTEIRQVPRPVEQWLAQGVTPPDPAAAVRDAFEQELAGGHPTGMRPSARSDGLWFEQTWELTVAVKPPAS